MPMPELPDIVNLAVPGFVLAMVAEVAWGMRKGRVRYEMRDTITSLTMGTGNLFLGLTLGAVVGTLLAVVTKWAPFSFADQSYGWSPWVFVLCFVLDDIRYYWYHRYMHEIRWFWGAHVTHHSSQHYNLSTALRQTWAGELTLGFLFHLPLLAMGFHPAMLAFVGGVNLVYQFWIHTELVDRMPPWFEAVFNTPSHHRVHHATNPRYLDANYAGVFILWDRMFGTFVPENAADPPIYGLTTQVYTFNPLRIAFHELLAMAHDASQPGLSLQQRLGYVLGPPGWSHDGSRQTAQEMKAAFVERHPEQAGQPGLPGRSQKNREGPSRT